MNTFLFATKKIHATKWQMDIEKYKYWRPWTSTYPALALPNVSKPSAEKDIKINRKVGTKI
jgi:hypothetical protein